MKIRALLIAMLLALLTVGGSVFAQDDEEGDDMAMATIAEIAAGDENFSTLMAAVGAADPAVAEALSNPEAELTVFAPTNAAFEALPGYVIDFLLGQTETLTNVLMYHVLDGVTMSEDVVGLLADGPVTVTTLAGEDITIASPAEGVITINQAFLQLDMVDIEASNGVIHVIDAVLVPPVELPTVDAALVTGDIVTAGSSTVGPLSEAIQQRFVDEGYAGEIANSQPGSGGGFELFCEAGETDISNASRPIRDSEAEACGELDPPRTPIEFRVGTDAIAVTVNPNNDFVDNLSFEDLQAIFSTAETWADVNPEWPEEPILRFIPGTDSGTFDFFVEEVFDEDSEPILNASNVNPNEDDNVLLEGVANNDFAIGFFGFAYFAQNEDALTLLSIDGVTPKATLDDYLLSRPLFIYSDAGIIEEKPQVGAFIQYYLNNVNDVITEVGYFPADPFTLNVANLKLLPLISE